MKISAILSFLVCIFAMLQVCIGAEEKSKNLRVPAAEQRRLEAAERQLPFVYYEGCSIDEECGGKNDYGRGGGYGRCYWLSCSNSRALRRCKDAEGTDCEMWGARAYPKCRDAFSNFGCCVCACDCA